MIEDIKNEQLIKKTGGRFKLTALIQKRAAELLQGSRPLIDDTAGRTIFEIIVQEILQDKVTYEGSPVDPGPADDAKSKLPLL